MMLFCRILLITRSVMNFFLDQLYQIQLIRDYFGPAGVTFMNAVSQGLLPVLALIPLYIYWCQDKKAGCIMAFSLSVGSLANHILKLTFCIERPWLLDARITPPEIAIRNQGGYSFPSGHAQLAAGYLIGTAVWAGRKKALSALCIIALILIGFSRVYLGVHTLLDVLAGVLEAAVLLWLFSRLINWFWDDAKRTAFVSAALVVIAMASAVYFFMKPYPLHFDTSGKLLTDPKNMITLSGVGATIGFAAGLYLERRFIRFSTAVPPKVKITRLIVGIIVYLPLYYFGTTLMSMIVSSLLFGLIFNIILWLFTLAGYPLLFKKIKALGGCEHGEE